VLRNDCDEAKIALSNEGEARLSCRHEGKSLSLSITREKFEEMTADLFQRTIDTCELVLQQAKMTTDQLDAVVLVGGSTLMPRVEEIIQQQLGITPYRDLSPYTAVAEGAAIHAAILEAKYRGEESSVAEKVRLHLKSIRQDEVNSHGLGVLARHPKNGQMINHVMIPRNSPLPVEKSQTFKTSQAGQQRVSIKVTEGDAPDPAAVSLIGTCQVSDLPRDLPLGSPIEVTYSFDASGQIHVNAQDKIGGKAAAIEIDRRTGLDETQLEAYTRLAHDYKVE
jgi:molecular chaperone DnaK